MKTDTDQAKCAVREALEPVAWRDMQTAPRDRTPVLLKLKDTIPSDREDLRRWDGLIFVGRNYGDIQDWGFAAPVGMGGFPDKWFEGWHPICTLSPTPAVARGEEPAVSTGEVVITTDNCSCSPRYNPDCAYMKGGYCADASLPAAKAAGDGRLTYENMEKAFSEFSRTLTVVDKPASFDSFTQGYVAGWNAKEDASGDVRAAVIEAIRDFCKSFGSQVCVVSSDGIERIYYSGLPVETLTNCIVAALSQAPATDAAAVASPVVGRTEWQDIETAPKDGSKIDLLFPYPRGRQNDCQWRQGDIYGEGGWYWSIPQWGCQPGLGIDWHLLPEDKWETGCYPNMQPTHWMCPPALPTPPSETKDAAVTRPHRAGGL